MQTKRNQKTVQERINTYTNNSKTNDFRTYKYQCSVNDRPYEEQNSCYDNGNNCRYNSNTTFAREEGQCIRKSGSFEFVVAGRTNQTCKNTDELIAGIAKSRPFTMEMLEEIVRTDSKIQTVCASVRGL